MIAGLNVDLFALLEQDTVDNGLAEIVGGEVRVYHLQAEDDAQFPYIVTSLQLVPDGSFWAIQHGQWIVDIWDQGADASTVIAMRNRVVALLDHRRLSNGVDYKNARLWLEGEGPASENSDRTWHITMSFALRVTATGDVAAVLQREGG